MNEVEYTTHLKRLEEIERQEQLQKAVKAANHTPGTIKTAPDGLRYQVQENGSWKKLPREIAVSNDLSS